MAPGGEGDTVARGMKRAPRAARVWAAAALIALLGIVFAASLALGRPGNGSHRIAGLAASPSPNRQTASGAPSALVSLSPNPIMSSAAPATTPTPAPVASSARTPAPTRLPTPPAPRPATCSITFGMYQQNAPW